MRAFFATFVVATIVCAALTPLVLRLALRLGAVASPGGRHVHERETPRLGGIAIFLAFVAPLLLLILTESSVAGMIRADAKRLLGVVIGATIMSGIGLLDDTRGVRALHKLYFQILAATVAFACGMRIDGVTLPVIGELWMGAFALPVTVFWIVGIINAINLIDGLDGLAGGVAFFAALTNFVVAYMSGAIFTGLMMAAMLGALLGFLFWNFNPARIFMGDSGSYFLGFVLATTSLVGAHGKTSTTVALLVPILALGVPIFDTIFAMVRRILERRPIFSPDRGHIHHRLVDMGLTHRRAVLTIYAVSIVFTAAAIAVSFGRSWHVGVALIAASVALIGLVRFVGYFEYLHQVRRQKLRVRTRHAELLRRSIPSLMEYFDADNEDAIFAGFEALMRDADLHSAELVVGEGADEKLLRRWGGDLRQSGRDVHPVVTRFAVGSATLRLTWFAENGEFSPQVDILLQVVVDVLVAQLDAVGSPIVVRPSAMAEVVSKSPTVAFETVSTTN